MWLHHLDLSTISQTSRLFSLRAQLQIYPHSHASSQFLVEAQLPQPNLRSIWLVSLAITVHIAMLAKCCFILSVNIWPCCDHKLQHKSLIFLSSDTGLFGLKQGIMRKGLKLSGWCDTVRCGFKAIIAQTGCYFANDFHFILLATTTSWSLQIMWYLYTNIVFLESLYFTVHGIATLINSYVN